jgi:hypothetical protein
MDVLRFDSLVVLVVVYLADLQERELELEQMLMQVQHLVQLSTLK